MQEPDIEQTEQMKPEQAEETSAEVPEATPDLAEQLRQAQLKQEEHYDAWLRAKAETENIRRRAQEDIAKAYKYSIEKFASELLSVKDSLEAALAAEIPSIESYKTGSELTLKQLTSVFEKSGIRQIDPIGEKFDPHQHQAISVIESDQEPNTVVTVLQKGYLLGERVLRPALVMVSKSQA